MVRFWEFFFLWDILFVCFIGYLSLYRSSYSSGSSGV